MDWFDLLAVQGTLESLLQDLVSFIRSIFFSLSVSFKKVTFLQSAVSYLTAIHQ